MKPLLAVAVWLAVGCGGDKKPNLPKADARATKPIDPNAAGVIRGVVEHAGGPQQREITITEAACKGGPKSEEVVTVANGRLANAFVWVKKGLEGWQFPAPSGEVVLDQKQCMYTPHVVGARVGQAVVFSTSDPVTHNVHTLPEENEPANFAMDHAGQRITRKFESAEVMIQTKCDIHPWMKAWIGVVDHPHFAVTGADGSFEFKGLPAGDYEVEVWHETLGRKSQTVTLADAATQEVKLGL
jgi:plastocyanin